MRVQFDDDEKEASVLQTEERLNRYFSTSPSVAMFVVILPCSGAFEKQKVAQLRYRAATSGTLHRHGGTGRARSVFPKAITTRLDTRLVLAWHYNYALEILSTTSTKPSLFVRESLKNFKHYAASPLGLERAFFGEACARPPQPPLKKPKHPKIRTRANAAQNNNINSHRRR